MPNFLTLLKRKEKTKTKSAKFSNKQLSASHKSFEVARSRGIPIAKILQYDLFPTNIYLMKIIHSNLIRPL